MSSPEVAVASSLAAAVERLVAALVRQPRMPGDEPGELSTFQGIALATLADEGPRRLGELADALGTTDATASRTLDVLTASGLAERRRDDDDARCVIVSATEAGRALVAQRRERLTRLVQRLVADLGPEEGARLAAVLGELGDILHAAGDGKASRV